MTTARRKKILVFAGWYEPGFKAGGPIRSCVNFVNYMRDDYLLDVFTSDRDLGSLAPYDGIVADSWAATDHPSVRVYYCSPGMLTWKNIREQMLSVKADFVYCNSMFSTPFTIYPLLISRLNKINARVVLSPRGMLRASALRYKPLKKKVFLKLFGWSGVSRRIFFHAADQTEMQDIKLNFGPAVRVSMIPNFPAAPPDTLPAIGKRAGMASLIFIGRIHPIKNLDYLLEALQEVRATIRLTIVGSIEDASYWERCGEIIRRLPGNITVHYAGEIPNHELPALSAQHHVFALPTQGENFGHAIFESLAIGRPALISDQTPWRNLLALKAGWDLSLDQPALFRDAIEQVAGFGQEEYDEWSLSTFRYIQDFVAGLTLREDYFKLFSEPSQATEGR